MISNNIIATGGELNNILLNIALAAGILLIGIFLGKSLGYIIKKITKKFETEKYIRPSFIGLISVVVQWSVYIGFLSLALKNLNIPVFTDVFTRVLITIPAFTGALVLIGIGFAIAVYLREVIEDSEVTEWQTLSKYLYYFVLYTFGVYALNLALISVDKIVRNWIIIILTTLVATALIYAILNKEIKN